MNEIDPSNSNGSAKTETHQQEASSSGNKAPLLSSLLTSAKHEGISNGQPNKSGHHKNDNHSMMPTPAIDTNPQYEEANAFMTKKPTSQCNKAANELELTTDSIHRKFNNLNDLLHRNNNNNKVAADDSTAKSILENCLLKPSPHKNQRLESQFFPKMDEGEYHVHHLGSPSTSSVLKFTEDSRKVEPLKINLNRDPIRTVIKLPTSHPHDSPTKIIIRPPQPPDRNSQTSATISPTLSSSSSLSSESSFDNCHESANNQRLSSIQVIPKLHIRNFVDGSSLKHEQSELHIVPKLKITGLNSPQSTVNNSEQQLQLQQPIRDHSVNIILEASPAIPKLTIKKDNNTSDYHLNNDSNSIPKLHIKTNHHLSREPPVPKLTIKTKTDNDAIIVANLTDSTEPIPKLTIKSSQQTLTPKLTIKPIVRSMALEQDESIPKLTLKAMNNSSTVPLFEKIVPKLVVKLPKEPIESSSCSSTPSPPLHVPKLNIKPIPLPEKEVPKPVKNCFDSMSPIEVKFSINRLIGSAESSIADNDGCKPLEINTSVLKNSDPGQDSPRIILKINKTNSESITSEIIPQPTTEIVQKTSAVNHKRTHSDDDVEDGTREVPKKAKLKSDADEDVIVINDSDTSSNETTNKNSNSVLEAPKIEVVAKTDDTKTNLSGILSRNLRQSKRFVETTKPLSAHISEQENSLILMKDSRKPSEIDPLALSNDTTVNSNPVDELITPKRGRGRPKKIVENPSGIVEESSRDPLEIPSKTQTQESYPTEDGTNGEKAPTRGRGRGRGRSKRTVEVLKNGKSCQITLEGHDDDDSPSFSMYNRSLRGTGRKSRGGKGSRGKGTKSSPFVTPERSKDGPFMSPDRNNRRKLVTIPSLFEEDTRMSIGGDCSQQTPFKSADMPSCEESQSSLLSNASNTIEGSSRKRQKKMEVFEPEG